MQEYLSSFNLLTTDEVEHVLALGTVRRLRQGAFLIRAGMVCQEVAFVESGLFRSFYYNSQGEEVTYCFTFSGSFVTAYSSFISQEKTMENIHAATDTEVFSIPRNAILALENTSMNWLRLSKSIAEQEYLKLEQRVFMLQKESAENRYRDLLLNYPEYLQQIPLQHLASYLGITQRHLSRIRRAII
jgi:CRP-like cAMP-binding protein